MRTRSGYITSLTLSMLLAVTGCRQNESGRAAEPKPMTIENITWQLAEVGGKPAEPVPADSRAAHFRLDSGEKRVSGYSGLNQFNGSYELTGFSLKFGPMAMTRRAGPAPLMQQESAFTRALEQTKSWRAAGESIELLDASGKSLARFNRAAP